MNRIAARFICSVLLCLSGSALGGEFYARVIAVLDGDTVLIRRSEGLVKIRLAEIDAPEKSQAFGLAARKALMELVLHKQVWVDTLAVDKYGREVAQIKVNGLSVNEEMVRRGMAWEYSHYHNDRRYIALQQEARQAGRGLWAQSAPLPPWQWRLQHVTDETAGHSTKQVTNTRHVAGYGEASRLPEQTPAVPSATTIGNSQTVELGRRKQHTAGTDVSPVLTPDDFTCGTKHRCSQMFSCDEAYYYLVVCNVKALNPSGDGVPCEKLCVRGGTQ